MSPGVYYCITVGPGRCCFPLPLTNPRLELGARLHHSELVGQVRPPRQLHFVSLHGFPRFSVKIDFSLQILEQPSCLDRSKSHCVFRLRPRHLPPTFLHSGLLFFRDPCRLQCPFQVHPHESHQVHFIPFQKACGSEDFFGVAKGVAIFSGVQTHIFSLQVS